MVKEIGPGIFEMPAQPNVQKFIRLKYSPSDVSCNCANHLKWTTCSHIIAYEQLYLDQSTIFVKKAKRGAPKNRLKL